MLAARRISLLLHSIRCGIVCEAGNEEELHLLGCHKSVKFALFMVGRNNLNLLLWNRRPFCLWSAVPPRPRNSAAAAPLAEIKDGPSAKK
jgi:hypothetical protein